MAATAVSLKASRISRELTNDEFRRVSRGESKVTSRLQLIETIKHNVMAWTKWKPPLSLPRRCAKIERED